MNDKALDRKLACSRGFRKGLASRPGRCSPGRGRISQKPSEKSPASETRDAESDAVSPIDPDFARVVAAWPTLPAAIRRAILGLIG